ncbi:MAG: PIG-L family deacetylase, partial [Chloroflexi bacterium]|nr:PIG-L family deacetylase [Chloroflexota bacterium]
MTGSTGTLLAVFAHPDDETFLAGALLAHLAARGVAITLVCATPEADAPPSSLPVVRRAELAEAGRTLGIRDVRLLNYSEAGLGRAEVPELTGRVLEVAREVHPDALLTDSAYGAYGHPHHMLLHRAAVAAGGALGLARRPTPVYALAYPLSLVRLNLALQRAAGVPVHALGGRADLDYAAVIAAQPPADLTLSVSEGVAVRRRA